MTIGTANGHGISSSLIYDPLLLVEEMQHRVANEYAVAISIIDMLAADCDVRARPILNLARDRLLGFATVHHALLPPSDDAFVELCPYLGRVPHRPRFCRDSGHTHFGASLSAPLDSQTARPIASLHRKRYNLAHDVAGRGSRLPGQFVLARLEMPHAQIDILRRSAKARSELPDFAGTFEKHFRAPVVYQTI